MRILFPILLIAGLVLACGSGSTTEVALTVIDRVSEQPLDSSAVIVFRYHPGEPWAAQDTHWTNAEGQLQFRLTTEPTYRYALRAERTHYQKALSPTGGHYENEALVEVADSNTFTLALEPITAPDPDRFLKMHADIPVKEVVAAIAGDHWTWAFLPHLTWEDIPSLLTIAGDTSYLAPYPHHPRSTYQPDSVRAGLVALWLIEAIRQTNENEDRPGALMHPSRAPVLGTNRGNPSGYNSLSQMARAHQAYQAWYETYREAPARGRRSYPLRGLGMSWM
jgi:hypothetical protein